MTLINFRAKGSICVSKYDIRNSRFNMDKIETFLQQWSIEWACTSLESSVYMIVRLEECHNYLTAIQCCSNVVNRLFELHSIISQLLLMCCIAVCSLWICPLEVERLIDVRKPSILIFVKLYRLITMFLGCSETNSLSAIIPQLKKAHEPKYSTCNFLRTILQEFISLHI